MKKGIVIWLVLIAIFVVGTVLQSKTWACDHDYVMKGNCYSKSCRKCGWIQILANAEHNFVYTDCYHAECSRCGLESEQEAPLHTAWCAGYDRCQACGKDMTAVRAENPEYHVTVTRKLPPCGSSELCTLCGKTVSVVWNHEPGMVERTNRATCESQIRCKECRTVIWQGYHVFRIDSELVKVDGKWYKKCNYCSELADEETVKVQENAVQSVGHKHKWQIVDCGDATYCEICGIDGGRTRYPRHQYAYAFPRVFNYCTACGKMAFQTSNFDWALHIGEVLAVFLIAFAFQYVIRKRKFIHFKWLIVMFMWLEENTHFGNFCPAVLWKKKLN